MFNQLSLLLSSLSNEYTTIFFLSNLILRQRHWENYCNASKSIFEDYYVNISNTNYCPQSKKTDYVEEECDPKLEKFNLAQYNSMDQNNSYNDCGNPNIDYCCNKQKKFDLKKFIYFNEEIIITDFLANTSVDQSTAKYFLAAIKESLFQKNVNVLDTNTVEISPTSISDNCENANIINIQVNNEEEDSSLVDIEFDSLQGLIINSNIKEIFFSFTKPKIIYDADSEEAQNALMLLKGNILSPNTSAFDYFHDVMNNRKNQDSSLLGNTIGKTNTHFNLNGFMGEGEFSLIFNNVNNNFVNSYYSVTPIIVVIMELTNLLKKKNPSQSNFVALSDLLKKSGIGLNLFMKVIFSITSPLGKNICSLNFDFSNSYVDAKLANFKNKKWVSHEEVLAPINECFNNIIMVSTGSFESSLTEESYNKFIADNLSDFLRYLDAAKILFNCTEEQKPRAPTDSTLYSFSDSSMFSRNAGEISNFPKQIESSLGSEGEPIPLFVSDEIELLNMFKVLYLSEVMRYLSNSHELTSISTETFISKYRQLPDKGSLSAASVSIAAIPTSGATTGHEEEKLLNKIKSPQNKNLKKEEVPINQDYKTLTLQSFIVSLIKKNGRMQKDQVIQATKKFMLQKNLDATNAEKIILKEIMGIIDKSLIDESIDDSNVLEF